jgi:uncharacterized membrane protein
MVDASGTESATGSRRTATDPPSVADAIRESGRSVAELLHYVAYLLSAKLDQIKLSIQTLILYAVLGVLAVVAAATVLIVSVVLLFTGIAHGLGSAMGGRDWLGDLIVSLIVLGGIAISLSFLLTKFKTASRRRTIGKYEDRRRQQREQFGRDVAGRTQL